MIFLMNHLKINRAVGISLPLVLGMLMLSLPGCDGGMVGTGSGPTSTAYELEHLPKRISPEIPKTLLKGDEVTPSESGSLARHRQEKATSSNSEEQIYEPSILIEEEVFDASPHLDNETIGISQRHTNVGKSYVWF